MRCVRQRDLVRNVISTAAVFGCVSFYASCSDEAHLGAGAAKVKASSDASGKEVTAAPAVGVPETTNGSVDELPSANAGSGKVGSTAAKVAAASQPVRVEREFHVSLKASGAFNFKPALNEVEQEVALENIYEDFSTTVHQVERPAVTKMFQQGTPGENRTETFDQRNSGVLDLVVVIDNSGSMSEEQNGLSDKLAPLLRYIQNSDWRINVLTTDIKNGCSRALINKGDANADAAFQEAIKAGTGGSGNEEGIRMAVEGFKCANGANGTSWVRTNSSVAALIVSE